MATIGDIVKAEHVVNSSEIKYGICVCVAENYYFLINTENRAMYDCIPILKKHPRAVPVYDSFIGCSIAHIIDPQKILEVSGKLEIRELRELLAHVEKSKKLPQTQKELICAELKAKLDPPDVTASKNTLSKKP